MFQHRNGFSQFHPGRTGPARSDWDQCPQGMDAQRDALAALGIMHRSWWDIRAKLAPSIPVHAQGCWVHHDIPAPWEKSPPAKPGGRWWVPKATYPTAACRRLPVGLRKRRRSSVAGISIPMSSIPVPCWVAGHGPSLIAAPWSSCR